MSQWSKIVEGIRCKANFTSCDSMPMNFDTLSEEQQETVYKIRQKQLKEAVLQDVENTYNKYVEDFKDIPVQIELNFSAEPFIKFIDDYSEEKGCEIYSNGIESVFYEERKEYTTYQWICQIINRGMVILKKTNSEIKELLNDLSDSHFKKLYKDITDYFVKKYAKTAINNPDEFNDWLEKHK